MSWPVEEVRAPAGDLHARPLPSPRARLVTLCHATHPALVLGSTQPEPPPRHPVGLDIVRRRSGGGAVIVGPGEVVWIDVTIPVDDPLWQPDVGRAFIWIGEAWARALATLGIETEVHRAGLVCTPWSRQVCFGGLGPGEVTVPSAGKIVGIAQRRTRELALFQCAALLRWDPDAYVDALNLPATAAVELASSAAPLQGVPDAILTSAFIASLP